MDSAPPLRRLLVASLPVDLQATCQELIQVTRLPRQTVSYHAHELVAIGVWEERGGNSDLYGYTDYGRDLVKTALPDHP